MQAKIRKSEPLAAGDLYIKLEIRTDAVHGRKTLWGARGGGGGGGRGV